MNILLATDGSRYATEAAAFLGAHLDPSARLRISVVAIVPPKADGAAASSSGSDARAREWLERTREALGPALATARTRILHGAPAEVLVRESGAHDLVVAGVKGCGAGPFFELGRVAHALLRHAECSVLLVRNQRSQQGDGHASNGTRESGGLRVLVSTCASSGNGTPVGWSLLQPFALSRASLEVVTVLDRNTRSSGAGQLRVSAGQPRWALLEGRPGAEIERRALETRADLIVVGARREASPGSGPLGSTARELAWCAPCSVLTVRHRDEPERPDALFGHHLAEGTDSPRPPEAQLGV